MSDTKKYMLVIHSGELRYPLLDAAENLHRPINEQGKVTDEHVVEIGRIGYAGSGIDLAEEKPAILAEIRKRHQEGQEISAIIGCPMITVDAVRTLRQEGIQLPENNIHLVGQMEAEKYSNMSCEKPGIDKLVENAATYIDVFENGTEATEHLMEDLLKSCDQNESARGIFKRDPLNPTPYKTRRR